MILCRKKEFGNFGEQIAVEYLEKNNYEIIERNFYCRAGEIDIIVKKNEEIIFIEVKTRRNNKFGEPIEAVNYIKRNHLYKTARYFLYKNRLLENFVRFDVIEVIIKDGKFKVNHIKQII